MMLYWFPGDLFFIDGGWQGLKLVAMVDLVLGPALTLILYKPGKPKLVMDMSLIAFIQIAALGYGFYTTHQQRTVAVVFAEHNFTTVSANDWLEAGAQLRKKSVEARPVPSTSLLDIAVMLTPFPVEGGFGKILEDTFNDYPGPALRHDQYLPIASGLDELRQHTLTVENLKEQGALQRVEVTLKKRSLRLADVELYPFSARYADGIAVFNPDNNRIIDYIAIDKSTADTQAEETVDVADGDGDLS